MRRDQLRYYSLKRFWRRWWVGGVGVLRLRCASLRMTTGKGATDMTDGPDMADGAR
jgi:hypothetical protein